MSVWESEECVQNWRMLEAHRAAQASGRSDDFLDYEITVLNPVRRYSMSARDSAPQDSNEALGV